MSANAFSASRQPRGNLSDDGTLSETTSEALKFLILYTGEYTRVREQRERSTPVHLFHCAITSRRTRRGRERVVEADATRERERERNRRRRCREMRSSFLEYGKGSLRVNCIPGVVANVSHSQINSLAVRALIRAS